jgi:hypothetical protein
MNNFSIKIIVSPILILFLCLLANGQSHKKRSSLSENDALNLLISKIRNDSLYSSWIKIECFHFYTEETTSRYFEFVVREKHGDDCPGDTITEPIVDRFRVMRQTKKIFYWDPNSESDDEYVLYDRSKLQRF